MLQSSSLAGVIDVLPDCREPGKEDGRNLRVDYGRVQRIADGRSRYLGVVDDSDRRFQVRLLVHVRVADADSARDRGHGGLIGHAVDQRLTPPGYEQIDHVLGLQHATDEVPVGGLDNLDRLLWDARLGYRLPNQVGKRGVGVDGLFAPTKNDRVAGLQTKDGDVNGNVGPALVDYADDA